jgi:hypothetical protein
VTEILGPGSFIEVRKILPLLTESSLEHPSFHVVALSLPGFGFSDPPTKKGFNLPQYAEVANKLMLSLGYEEYGKYLLPRFVHSQVLIIVLVTQGGDWGYYVRQIPLRDPQLVFSLHRSLAPSPFGTVGNTSKHGTQTIHAGARHCNSRFFCRKQTIHLAQALRAHYGVL